MSNIRPSDEFASAEVMVLAAICGATAHPYETEYIMNSLEKYAITADWFSKEAYKKFFSAAMATWNEYRDLDLFHIAGKYDGERSEFSQIYQEMLDQYSTSSYLDQYLQAFKKKRVYSVVYKLMYEQLQELTPEAIGVQVEDFTKKLHDVQETLADTDGGLKQIADFMESSIAMKVKLHEERFVKHNWTFMDGLPFPWHEVNQIFSGLKTGLHVIGALASQGKSTMAVDLSVFWNQMGIKHGYISIDMAAEQYIDRMPCVDALVSLAKLNFGGSAADVEKFKLGFERQAKLNNVWISEADDTKTIEYQCFRGVRSLGWKAIIIDYIQLVTYNEGKGNLPEYTRVQRCVQEVKKIAKRLKVPVICLAQLSRAFEKELRDAIAGNKAGVEPGLDAIGDSAEIARAAASVTVLYQDEDMRRYWKETPPTQLAFGDKYDKAWEARVTSQEEEYALDRQNGLTPGTTTAARRNGQLSLAKSLRPVWFEVLKNQQGGKGKIPFVMFANYFLFRPGNSEGMDQEVMIGGKSKKLPVGKFEQIRDDWVYTDQDWWLEMTNVIPQRGCKLMGETYPQMRKRQAEERAQHRSVRQFVRDYDDHGRNEVGWHWEEAEENENNTQENGQL